MPRKKSVAPDPKEQELDQSAAAAEGAVAEEAVDNDGAPSDETLALMEQEYLESSADGDSPPESWLRRPRRRYSQRGRHPSPRREVPDSGEQTQEAPGSFHI